MLDNCYIEAQKLGKSRALCVSGSSFNELYAICHSCIAANSNDPNTVKNTVSSQLQPFVDYYATEALQNLTQSITSTATSSQVTSFNSLLNAETTTATIFATPANQQVTNTNQPFPSNKTRNNLSWTGAVIGLIALLVLATSFCFLQRRRKRRKAPSTNKSQSVDETEGRFGSKAQLHGDSRMLYELHTVEHGDEMPELQARERAELAVLERPVELLVREKVELPARELVGAELSGGENHST